MAPLTLSEVVTLLALVLSTIMAAAQLRQRERGDSAGEQMVRDQLDRRDPDATIATQGKSRHWRQQSCTWNR
jgi:hypothetical protein